MKSDKFLITIFLVIIFGVLLFLPVKHVLIMTGKSELVLTDNWQVYNPVGTNVIGKVQDKIKGLITSVENRVTNYFPLYYKLNSLYENVNYEANRLLFKDVIPMGTNSDGEYIFYDQKNNFYYLRAKYNEDVLNEKMNKQIAFFNNLSDKIDKDIYIYLPLRYDLTSLSENNLQEYLKNFKSEINPKITVKEMNITSLDEYQNYFYKTDHHWNINGALKGYKDIMTMLNVPYHDNLKTKVVLPGSYYGSIAKSVVSKRVSDDFMDVDYYPDYKVNITNEKFKPRKMTYQGNNPYYDYYVHYFNGQYGRVIYDYNAPEKENLLILSDSYSWQIDYLIAEGFNKTHVINVRYDEYKDGFLDIKKYIEEEKIDKVLFLYEGVSSIFDMFNYDIEGKVQ